jgi:hypothetical protein
MLTFNVEDELKELDQSTQLHTTGAFSPLHMTFSPKEEKKAMMSPKVMR